MNLLGLFGFAFFAHVYHNRSYVQVYIEVEKNVKNSGLLVLLCSKYGQVGRASRDARLGRMRQVDIVLVVVASHNL